jgi:hypothetical protein
MDFEKKKVLGVQVEGDETIDKGDPSSAFTYDSNLLQLLPVTVYAS